MKLLRIYLSLLLILIACQTTQTIEPLSIPPQQNTELQIQKPKSYVPLKFLSQTVQDSLSETILISIRGTEEFAHDDVTGFKHKCSLGHKQSCDLLKKCGSLQTCKYEAIFRGLGFFDQSTGLLISTRHLFSGNTKVDSISFRRNLNDSRFVLLNQKNKEIFSSTKGDTIISVIDPCEGESPEEIELQYQCDFLMFKLSRLPVEIKGLKAGKIPARGSTVFSMKFPDTYNSNNQLKYRDNRFEATKGTIDRGLIIMKSQEDTLMKLLESNPELKEEFNSVGESAIDAFLDAENVKKYFFDGTIWAWGLATFGMSGAPIVDSNGQWVGLLTGSRAEFTKVGSRQQSPFLMGVTAERFQEVLDRTKAKYNP